MMIKKTFIVALILEEKLKNKNPKLTNCSEIRKSSANILLFINKEKL